MSSDEALYDAYRDRNDETALRQLVERHWPGVFRLAHAIVGDAPAAEDVAQEALVRVVQAARAKKRLDPFAGWMRSVTVNEARMSLRSKRRRERREEEAALRARPAASPLDPAAAVREYTEGLDERVRLPLVLHYGLGLSHAEVGEAIGCPAGTASSRIREGLEEVRSGLAKSGVAVEPPAIGPAFAVLGAGSVPPVPRIETLVAKAAAAQAVGVAAGAGKKLGVAVVAFVLCAGGMGAFVVANMGEPAPEVKRVAIDPSLTVAPPATPPVHHAPVVSGTETPVAVPAPPTKEEPVMVPFNGPVPGPDGPGPKRMVLGGGPDGGPRFTAGAPAAPVPARAKGRVVDPQGNGVPGAKVSVLGSGPRGARDIGIRMKRRARGVRVPGGEPGKMPNFKVIDDEVQRAMGASLTMRGLTELATAQTGPDGTFELGYERIPGSEVFVAAEIERDGATLGAEKPLPGEDAGDIAIQRLPALVVSVTSGGAPVEGASVDFVDAGGDTRSASTDTKGLARRATRAPRVLVTVRKAGFATARADSVLAPATSGTGDTRLDVLLVPSAQVLGTIRGPDNQPLAGVPIVLEDPEGPDVIGDTPPFAKTTTDEHGRYSVDGLAPGRRYELEATPAEVAILKGHLSVTAPDNSADLALGRAGRIVCEVKVTGGTDDPRFKEWPGIDVQRQEGGQWGPVMGERTVAGTKVTFSRLPAGTYRVFSHPLMFPKAESEPVTVPADGGTFETSISLNAGRTITGRVLDPTGQPMKRARVMRAEQGMMVAMIVQSDTGRFELAGVSNERFTFTVAANGYEDRSVTAEPGRNDVGDIVLTPAKPDPESEKSPQDKTPEDR